MTDELLRHVNAYRQECELVQGHGVPSWRALTAYVDSMIAAAVASKQEELDEWRFTNKIDELQRLCDAKQAKIDALMLEFCPEEMTPEQVKTWGEHQRVAPGSNPMSPQEIWNIAVKFAGTQQINNQGILVFETPQDFADCFQNVLQSLPMLQKITQGAFDAGKAYGELDNPDTVRLDWFQKQIKVSSIRLANLQFKSVNAWAISADGEDLRATIDAVMAQQKEPK